MEQEFEARRLTEEEYKEFIVGRKVLDELIYRLDGSDDVKEIYRIINVYRHYFNHTIELDDAGAKVFRWSNKSS